MPKLRKTSESYNPEAETVGSEKLEAALAYAEQFGWAVFPCRPGDKKPLTQNGFKDASKDPTKIKSWWEQHPDANIGIATGPASGVWALDIDAHHGGDATLAELEQRHASLPPTVCQRTPNGGRHYFFRTSSKDIRNSAGRVGAGIDVRGDGGYVVVGPSAIRAEGVLKLYRWHDGCSPNQIAIAEAPEWLLQLGTKEERARTESKSNEGGHDWSQAQADVRVAVEGILAKLKAAQEGTRNDTLNKCAFALGQFVGGGAMSREQAEGILREAAPSGLDFPQDEVERTIKSGLDAGEKEPRQPPPPKEDANTVFARLAVLSPIEYDKVREAEAKRLGCRVTTLDDEVEKVRRAGRTQGGSGQPLDLKDPTPWPQPVDGAKLLDDIAALLQSHLVLPKHAAEAIALWVALAHAIDAVDVAPRLAITSPQMRCGKTTLLDIIQRMVRRALASSNITPAALFRTIEAAKPTLLIDEADSFLSGKSNDLLRGLLNSGHTRPTAYVVRSVGDDHEPRRFSTWCAMVIAAIGRLPNTLEDRSINIRLQRKRKEEEVTRLPSGQDDATTAAASRLARWTQDHFTALREAEPTNIPAVLNDRAADSWRPLFAIADLAGGHWPERARQAAIALSKDRVDDDTSVLTQLLADIKVIFAQEGTDRVLSKTFVDQLGGMEDRLWPEWQNGKPMTATQLARLLKPFEISPTTVRVNGGYPAKGYKLADFRETFERYLPNTSPARRYDVTGGAPEHAEGNGVTLQEDENAAEEMQSGTDAGVAEAPLDDPPEDDLPPKDHGQPSSQREVLREAQATLQKRLDLRKKRRAAKDGEL